jgi:hypothetical protein
MVRFVLLIGAIAVAPFGWRSQWRLGFVLCLALVVYNQATVALAATPENRYTFYIVPPLLAAVTMGLKAHTDRLGRKPSSRHGWGISDAGKTDRKSLGHRHAGEHRRCRC